MIKVRALLNRIKYELETFRIAQNKGNGKYQSKNE